MKMIPTISLNSGYEMPVLGFGTWQIPPEKVAEVVGYAIDCGYRHFDCAWMYQNEKEIGNIFASKIKDGVVKREDLFVTSKLWCSFNHPNQVRKGFMQTLKNLQLDYLDLYLVHFPVGLTHINDQDLFNFNENGELQFSDVDYVDTWKEMEKLVDDKLVRSIGISNYNEFQCKRMMKNCKIPPAVNQIELHPYLVQESLVKCCKDLGICVAAYSPLGSRERPWGQKDDPVILDDPFLQKLASNLKKSSAQIAIRLQIDRNLVVIAKSSNLKRMKENIEVFDFKLSDENLSAIFETKRNFRAMHWNVFSKHKCYPFQDDYKE